MCVSGNEKQFEGKHTQYFLPFSLGCGDALGKSIKIIYMLVVALIYFVDCDLGIGVRLEILEGFSKFLGHFGHNLLDILGSHFNWGEY